MKKILSTFMVAVLGLNLLYQPCMAAGGKKEAASSVTQESVSVGDQQTEKPSGKAIKAKAEEQQSKTEEKSRPKASSFNKVVVYTIYAICLALTVYGIGYSYGYKHDAYNDGFKDGFRSGELNGMLFFVNEGQKAVIDKYCEAKQTDVAFPIDKMSKKCLKQMLLAFHPDKFGCYEDINDFYVKIQNTYEKME